MPNVMKEFVEANNSFLPSVYRVSCKNAKLLELQINGDASMVFVLPNERDGLAYLENKIDKVFLPYKFISTEVIVFIPKFKIEYQTDFNAVLRNVQVSFTTLGSQNL
jgi:serine protease inhibitor